MKDEISIKSMQKSPKSWRLSNTLKRRLPRKLLKKRRKLKLKLKRLPKKRLRIPKVLLSTKNSLN